MTFEVSLVGIKLYEGEWKQHSHKNREFINTKINSLIVFFTRKKEKKSFKEPTTVLNQIETKNVSSTFSAQ